MDPIYREQLTYSLGLYFREAYNGQGHSQYSVKAHVPVDLSLDNKIEEILAVLDPKDFLSQALRYYQHCALDPKGHKEERRILEIQQRVDDEYGQFLKDNNLLKYTAHDNWLEEALKTPAEGRLLERHRGEPQPAIETDNDKRRTQLKYAIDSEMETLTDVPQKRRPKDSELLTICPATIESSFSLLAPFDYTGRYSLHYISLRKFLNIAHEDADQEAQIRHDDHKAEHFELLREESRQLVEWEKREEAKDKKYWKKIEDDPDDFTPEDEMSEEDESGDDESEDEGSEGEGSEDEGSDYEGSEDDGSEEDGSEMVRQRAMEHPARRISGKKSNGEGGGLTKTAKKRPFDDSDDTDDAAASGYKRAKVEPWRERFNPYKWMRIFG
ncbi:hypothetical protein FANTH_8294 [Fusarium anthophilum]|uniref:Uncharacterized protein n=1 Tax=Fusarium anthophilum TaxID=48485 RepID=A0A8H4ZBU7_9HYPO|nr:hypothetical protein FANTH_8294 [Fusarium anthophilum]